MQAVVSKQTNKEAQSAMPACHPPIIIVGYGTLVPRRLPKKLRMLSGITRTANPSIRKVNPFPRLREMEHSATPRLKNEMDFSNAHWRLFQIR